MAELRKPTDLSKVWAIVGDTVEPPDVKKDTGWIAGEIPARQYFNWLDQKQDAYIAHANQHGIPVWDAETEYQALTSYCQARDNGKTYVCIETHTNQDPNLDLDGTYWELAFAPLLSPIFSGEPRATTALLTDNSDRIATTAFVQGLTATLVTPSLVRRPKNVTPADAATAISASPTLTADAYHSLYGITQASAQFQVSTVPDFSSTVVNATVGAVNTYNVVAVLSGINYWRARYTDSEGAVSDWSVPTQFTTAAIVVNTPTITSPANNDTGVLSNPTITSSAFGVTGGSDTHLSTDWEIRTAPGGGGGVQFSSYNDTTNKTTIVVPLPNSLSQSAVYYVRTRYRGTTYGYSGWTENKFTTAAQFFPTVIGQAYGGGYYAGRIAYGGKTYALIVAPKASGENVAIGSPAVYDVNNPAARPAKSTYDGLSNTNQLLSQAGTTAPKWADSLTIGGYTDWYIPSRYEMSVIYKAFKPTSATNVSYTTQGDFEYYGPNNPFGVPPYSNTDPVITPLAPWIAGGSEAFTAGTAETGNAYWQSFIHPNAGGSAPLITLSTSFTNFDYNRTTPQVTYPTQRARAIRRVEVPAGL